VRSSGRPQSANLGCCLGPPGSGGGNEVTRGVHSKILADGNPHRISSDGYPTRDWAPPSFFPLPTWQPDQPAARGRDRRASWSATVRWIVPSMPESHLGRAGGFLGRLPPGWNEAMRRSGVNSGNSRNTNRAASGMQIRTRRNPGGGKASGDAASA
jgi:hypothetical protein